MANVAKVKHIFNENYGVDIPTLILERRDFSKLETIKNASEITYKDNFHSPELSFKVHKDKNSNWDNINNYNIVYIPEYEENFAIHVNTNEESLNYKTVTGTFLPKEELQNVKLHNIEINTEDDIARDDYDKDYPTVFCRDLSGYEKGSAMYKKRYNASLLHRILDKASNYTIGHVDESLMHLKTWFQYSISEGNVYDELTGEISEDYQCLFIFDSVNRTVNAYDLCNTCSDCGYRGDFHDACPECGSLKFRGAYGDDTAIFISKDNLATAASVESNKDNLKNCFYVQGGDDMMTAAVALANPNGSNYFYSISEEMYENMPEDLVSKLKAYNDTYNACLNTNTYQIDENLVSAYNNLITDINKYYPSYDSNGNAKNRYPDIPSSITGYKNISSICLDCIDIALTLQTSMGKTMQMDSKTIEETMNMLTASNLSPISVKSDLSKVTPSVVTNTVLGACKALINTSLYKVEVIDDSYSHSSHKWTGKFKLTSMEDDRVALTGELVSIDVNNDMETYLKQNIQRELNKLDTNYKDLRSFDTSDADFKSELKYYSFDYLSGLKDSYSACLSIILDSNTDELKQQYLSWYNDHIGYIETEMNIRQSQLDTVYKLYHYENQSGVIYDIQSNVNAKLDFESYLGEDLWKVFCSYKMEDTYKNDNYVSDGLDNTGLLSRANELIETAKKELYKASHIQYSVHSTINNLLALKEFQPIGNDFKVGNWIHVCVDEKIYNLRLLSYQIYFDEISKIDVEFSTVEKTWSGISDIEDVIRSAQGMAGSYSYTVQKVKNNTNSSRYVENWVQKGLDATATKIVNNADNQSIVYDYTGLLCRTYDDIADNYEPCQSKFMNSGLYVTDNGWESVKAAVGKYIYINPISGEERTKMGVLADTIVGKFILGENLSICNSVGSLEFTDNGLVISNGTNTISLNPNKNAFEITKGTQRQLYIDTDGNINLCGGQINISNGNFVVDTKGNLTSKGIMSLGNGSLTYKDSKLTVSGDINAASFICLTENYKCSVSNGFSIYNNSSDVATSYSICSASGTGHGSMSLFSDSLCFYEGNNFDQSCGELFYDTAGFHITKRLDIGTASIIAGSGNRYAPMCNCDGDDETFYFGAPSDEEDKFNHDSVLRGKNVRIYAHGGGGVYLGSSGSTAVTSDENMKNIFEISNKYVDFFHNLKPIAYKYKVGHRTHIGFGARAVEDALIQSGLTTEEFAGVVIDKNVNIGKDEKISLDNQTYFDELYSLRYEEFTALNTLMIQKLKKENEELRELIFSLSKRIDAITKN